jgi:hypothetical protein
VNHGSFGYESGDGIAHPPVYSGLDDDGNWDPPGTCPKGCGQPKDQCICKPQPFRTLTDLVREAEIDVNEEDLAPVKMTKEEWQKIRQWPEDGNSK